MKFSIEQRMAFDLLLVGGWLFLLFVWEIPDIFFEQTADNIDYLTFIVTLIFLYVHSRALYKNYRRWHIKKHEGFQGLWRDDEKQ